MPRPATDAPVILNVDARGVARVTLNRPEVGNAYDGTLVTHLGASLNRLAANQSLRLVVLTGRGKHFQAGADLTWVRAVSGKARAENVRASRATAAAIDRLNRLPVPTLALVQGACFGGGTGLLAACDVVIAADNAVFSIAEVRWGLTAAIIIPQLSDALSIRQLRRYALTAERFDAREAQRIGLVHEVVARDELERAGEAMAARLLENGPRAVGETKRLVLERTRGHPDRKTAAALVASHATTRRSAEAREGLKAFAEKRAASWRA